MPWNDRIKRRLKLRDLEILTALIDSGSTGKTANRLGVSQPAISKATPELERALGVPLVDRSRRGIMPTPYGNALKQRSVAIFNDLRQGVAEIDTSPKCEIRIGATDPIMAANVSPTIDRLSRKYPKVVFRVVLDDKTMLYREVAQRNIELAICRMLGHLPGRTGRRDPFSRCYCRDDGGKQSIDAAAQVDMGRVAR